ncbi:MAG: phosphoenolpyruvate synthase [Flavobacteriales bacterium]|nr:phosphoenolpyruvate synthase [Flavobacteriales bacterium]
MNKAKLKHIDLDSALIGGKASNLLQLEKLGQTVPSWMVIPYSSSVPEVLNGLQDCFGESYKSKTYAVRSSAIDEDGSNFSFAGLFESYLNVPFTELENKITAVRKSTQSEHVQHYRKSHNLPEQNSIGVIIQEMINAEVSGVAFGLDPKNHDPSKKVISAVWGIGEGLVSGDLEADIFVVKSKKIERTIASKTHQYVFDTNGGLKKIPTSTNKINASSLTDTQILEIATLLETLEKELGQAQDIEFAIAHEQLYLLQTRPITTVPEGEYIVWDNSNIIESYPGITTPLTYSFISKMYAAVYRQFVGIMGVKDEVIQSNANVFENTLGLVRGRVYYNLLSWYKMLAMLPGYSINAENMERMMGVKESFNLGDEYKMSKGAAWLSVLRMLVQMIYKQLTLPKERKRFIKKFHHIMDEYERIDLNTASAKELIGHYTNFEKKALLQWKAPLINDFFAMIWFGSLQKTIQKIAPESPNLHNDLLCGSQDIISTEPIHKCLEISSFIASNEMSKKLFTNCNPKEIWEQLSKGTQPEVKEKIDDYLKQFGNRCVGELKLETISYSQNPVLFIKVIQSYVVQDLGNQKTKSSIDTDLRQKAEDKLNTLLKEKPLQRLWVNYLVKKTREHVSSRENLRFERTRGFGMVRNIFSALGRKWHENGLLHHPQDIFYLELDEILNRTDSDYLDLVQKRKNEFDNYKNQQVPQERFFTYEYDFSDHYIYSDAKVEGAESDLKGIGCCPGIVEAKAKVVLHPEDIDSLNGAILVTSSTDPGWVTLFPTATAIVVERGSLLSHSAIVSREMGIPCIVGVTGLLRTIKTGDNIKINGSTGQIQIVSND